MCYIAYILPTYIIIWIVKGGKKAMSLSLITIYHYII